MSFRTAFLLVPVTLALALAIPQPAFSYDYSYARVVRLSLVQGDVQVARPDQQNWETAIVNLPIQQGYTLATGQGRAEVEFESGATARIAENSILQFTELALANGGRITKLTLTQGTATFYANLSRDDSFAVLTPQLQVTIPENARLRVDVYDQGTTLSVLKGNVTADTPAGSNRLSKGHTLAYSSDQPDQVRLERNPKPDEWDRWVADRDDGITDARNASASYVSASYSYGLADLGNYGSWFPVRGYGYGWQPWGISSDWLPFWYGRWGFFPGLGWTWISYEPWGWMPYHFGRWLYSPGFGWVWLPGYFNNWCPAPVYWVQTGNGIGWVPLGPRDPAGQVPKNPTPPVVVGNTPTGLFGGAPNQRLKLIAGENPRFLAEPPIPAGSLAGAAGFRGTTAGFGKTGAQPGIFFDPKERRFLNNGVAPLGPDATTGTTPSHVTPAPAQRGTTGAATVTPRAPALPPRPTFVAPPPRMENRQAASPSPRGERAPARIESPRPAPPPRVENQRPAPPPRRIESAPARTESPRPAPPPRMESPAPRPSPPPPAPHSGGRPHGRD